MFLLTNSATLSAVEIKTANGNQEYLPHNPIYINGNEDFTPENGVTAGSGTEEDPYIIEGWVIKTSYNKDGITIENVNVYFVIKNCYIYSGGKKNDGIVFANVENGVIEKNIIAGTRNGILFGGRMGSCNNVISNNSITSNSHDGIRFVHTLDQHGYNILTHNYIADNNGGGIYMIMSGSSQIIFNNITSNGEHGILLDICAGGGQFNNIHHNNFIDNSWQALEYQGPENYWNDSYPSGGNYWCDYTGEDYFSGPNQDIPGSDGIGDTPYEIPHLAGEANWDEYPLMSPCQQYENTPPGTPTITGRISGKVGVRYEYTFATTDPNGDAVSYYIDWGDGTSTGWTNYFESGIDVKIAHTWYKIDYFSIRCKAKDIYGAEGNWTNLVIYVFRNKAFNFNINLLEELLFERFPNLFPILRHLLRL